MAGKTEANLADRIEQVNGLIDDAYADMNEWSSHMNDDEPDMAAKAVTMYNLALKQYTTFLGLLMTMTKNYDEAVNVDNKMSKHGSSKEKTVLEKLREGK